MMFPPIVHVALENKGSLDAVGLLAGAAFGAALRSRARYMLITAQSELSDLACPSKQSAMAGAQPGLSKITECNVPVAYTRHRQQAARSGSTRD